MVVLLVGAVACRKEANEPPVPIRVAVASNFAAPMERLAREFQARSGVSAVVSSGSSGKLYAQVENGAPFDVFLSADAMRPERLEQKGFAVPGSRFTYAVGRLALYGPAVEKPEDGLAALRAARDKHVSIANPEIAPYGVAAKQVMERAGMYSTLSDRIVRGENIAQAFQFVETGAAEIGFVALSSVIAGAKYAHWVVPEELHDPIRQDAVLVKRSGAHPRAADLMTFLRGPEAERIIVKAGYSIAQR
jgi:molybdate transport system substrate-binding protein